MDLFCRPLLLKEAYEKDLFWMYVVVTLCGSFLK